MDKLKPCPFCQSVPQVGGGMLVHPICECYGDVYIEWDKWQNRPIEDALQNQLNVMSEHSAALAVSNYDLIAENNALQQRVEELEMNIKEAVKEIDNMRDFEPEDQIDAEWLHAVMRVLDILRRHGLVEDK